MKKGRKRTFCLSVLCTLALLLTFFGFFPRIAHAAGENRVTALGGYSSEVEQGEITYCTVFIDSLENLSSLSVEVHYDPQKIEMWSSYNIVSSVVYDSSTKESSLQYSYIFDGTGGNTKTQLFYFNYRVLDDAEPGRTYFDIIVSEAFDSSLASADVVGSRHSITVTEKVEKKTTYAYAEPTVETQVKEEFEVNYSVGMWEVASGSFLIQYDAEMFEVVSCTPGGMLEGKTYDINSSLTGAVYLSFAGDCKWGTYDLLKVRFRTKENVATTSKITVTAADLYDADLSEILCDSAATDVTVAFDPVYAEDAPAMTVAPTFDAESGKVTAVISLEEISHLGAGDFILKFDSNHLTYVSAEKGFVPDFFTVNDKDAASGILKFSIISFEDILEEHTVLTVTFDSIRACTDVKTGFELSGSGLADAMTDPILLNFIDANLTIPLCHDEIPHDKKDPTCTEIGWDAYVTCSRCDYTTYNELEELGHDEIPHDKKDPTCTEIGWDAYVTCSRCDYTTYNELEELGHDEIPHDKKDPTCTEIGWDAYVTCSRCDYTTYNELEELGHDEIPHDKKDPTCTEIGWDAYVTCSRCDHTTYNELVALGHDYEETVVPPDDGEDGYLLYECKRCDHSYKEALVTGILGDMDGNEEVNSDDAIYLLKHTLFPDLYPINQFADFDGSEDVNSDDAIYLLKHTLFPEMFPLQNGTVAVMALPPKPYTLKTKSDEE